MRLLLLLGAVSEQGLTLSMAILPNITNMTLGFELLLTMLYYLCLYLPLLC